ncbi:MAG: hypothetical protein JSU92_04060 [Deltaproteobacteria bacterium]|nr:MAG: hypothetical protein JSU92_04060 [Deltaproteobacteria bacterium]
MNNKGKKEKEIAGAKKSLIGQYILNLIGLLITTPLFVYIVFVTLGDGAGSRGAVQVFLLIYIPFFTLIQPVGAIVNVHRDFLRGRWVMKEGEAITEPDSIINPWRRVGPWPLILGIATVAAISLALQLVSTGPFNRLNINLLAFIPTLILSTIFIWRSLPPDQVSFVSAFNGSRARRPEPFLRYFLFEHAGPWVPLQAIINIGFALRVFGREALNAGGNVPAISVAVDAGFTTGIIIFFMWLSSQGQVRSDLHLGRVSRTEGKGAAVPLMLGLFVVLSITVIVMVGVALTVAGIESMTIFPATVIKIAIAITATVAGCWLGFWWGRRRESTILLSIDRQSEGK